MRGFLASYFGDKAVTAFANQAAQKVYDTSADTITDFVYGHDATLLKHVAYPLRYLMIETLLRSHDKADTQQRQSIKFSIFKLLFTQPYPTDYETFEDEWAQGTTALLRDVDIHRVLSAPQYLPFMHQVMDAQMQAYRDVSGDNVPECAHVGIDLHMPELAVYDWLKKEIRVNPFKQGHEALNVMGGALHEQAHHVSITRSEDYVEALRRNAPAPKSPFNDMALIIALEQPLYHKIANIVGTAAQYSTMTERVACNFSRKVEYALLGIKPRAAFWFDVYRAHGHAPEFQPQITRMQFDYYAHVPSVRTQWQIAMHQAKTRALNAVGPRAHRVG